MLKRKLGNSGLELSAGDLATIDSALSAITVQGERYAAKQTAWVNR